MREGGDQRVVQCDQHRDKGERESSRGDVAVILERGAEKQTVGAECPEHARREDGLIDADGETRVGAGR